MVLETILKKRSSLERHLAAPLLEDRERFLSHLRQEGASQFRLKRIAPVLIRVIRLLRLKKLRDLRLREIQKVANSSRNRRGMGSVPVAQRPSEPYFIRVAKRWLRFLRSLKLPRPTAPPFANKLSSYAQFLRERGLCNETIRARSSMLRGFLKWYSKRHRSFGTVCLDDVDKFFDVRREKGWCRGTFAAAAVALKSFFQHAEDRHWCARGVARGIKGPSVSRYRSASEGPGWHEVRRLLRATCGSRTADIRARAVLFLLAVYGLRANEVARLLLTDFDWPKMTLDVRRLKGGRFQRFPIQREVGDAVRRYITEARPICSSPHLFITLHPPFRPICSTSLWAMTSIRLERLGINCRPKGPHSLRHACATRLLHQGASLGEVSNFLGHHDLQSVRIYARCDMEALREVADLGLSGLL